MTCPVPEPQVHDHGPVVPDTGDAVPLVHSDVVGLEVVGTAAAPHWPVTLATATVTGIQPEQLLFSFDSLTFPVELLFALSVHARTS